ncbi:DUF3397 domain-containing protein [Lactobacillus sp. ESL0684]|uniref:DUF3397 domain-containing protein n=1 Tax=Lactobacillus sp. ESL0684 TaxID=2983213 RepID=UPI0023F66716|nr:DUF3397 domain-containing protein [Lactobacillus sp. ESL0684]WEV42901.1 DUF3397 domain-containing protein [Lactobacillus sp. ESL0684]
MFLIFLAPIIGLALAFMLNKAFPKALFRGYDVLPLFFCFACHLITTKERKPEFLPYGFLLFFILVIVVAVSETIKYKNISLQKTLRQLWDYLTACTIFWYIGLLFLMI